MKLVIEVPDSCAFDIANLCDRIRYAANRISYGYSRGTVETCERGSSAAGGTFRVSGRNVCSYCDKGLTFCACARERNDAKAEVPACD